ncbi:MAG: hypothetical protein GQ553_02585 [Nitrosomonadaceae bacterium]|nr:hypothetical protein [Nitrosomonadaceae bacterium]
MSKAEEYIEHVFREDWMSDKEWSGALKEIAKQHPNVYAEITLEIVEAEGKGFTFDQLKKAGKDGYNKYIDNLEKRHK